MIWMIFCENISLGRFELSGYISMFDYLNYLYIVYYLVLTLTIFVRVIFLLSYTNALHLTKPKQIEYEIAYYFIINYGIVHWAIHMCYVNSSSP